MIALRRLCLGILLLTVSPGVSAGGDPAQCRNIRFGIVGFSDVAAVSAITAEILQELGYAPTTVNLSVPIIFASLQSRNIDVFLGNWMPAQEADRRPYLADGSVEVLGPNLENAKFTLAVPKYLYDAGLRDFSSIKTFTSQLNASIYGIEPGAAANRLVLGMIKTNVFGLGSFRLVESSEQGMLAELERAYRVRKPIVFVGWDPHPMNIRFQIRYLTGGDSTFGPNFGGATINTVTRSGFSVECPNAGRLLHNLKFTLRGESEIMAAILDGREQPDVAAKAWLDSNRDAVSRWLAGVTTFHGEPAPATHSALAANPEASSLEHWMLSHKIPLGDTAATALDRVKSSGSGIFNAVAAVIRGLVEVVNRLLHSVPALVFILITSVLTWLIRRSWPLTLFVPLALVFVLNQGYWLPMLETLSLVLVATLSSIAIGIPVGIAGAHHPRFYAALRPILDLMQTLPTFVYLIPTLVLFGLGPVPGLISTVVFALPAPIRLTREGIAGVPAALREAAQAFGATDFQLLWKVELPSASPLILAGVTQAIMLSLSMVVIAGLVGAGGLGVPVVRALNSVQIGEGFDAGFVIVLLAILLDRMFRPRSQD